MDTTKSSPFSSFKSEKQLRLRSPDQKARKAPEPEQNPKTPGKPDQPRRLRNRSAALSIKEIREAARIRHSRSDPPAPAVEQEVEHVSKPKKSAAEIKLPEKYELLDDFFNSLDSSIRLLQMKKYPSLFTKISPQIEILTDRRFTHNHLAQLKFIMPEAIVLEKVLCHDERTGCMKPDIRITLDAEAIEIECTTKSDVRTQQMRKIFRRRLLEFFKSHPEADEVPAGALPVSYNRLNETASLKSVQVQPPSSSSTSVKPGVTSVQRNPVALSHTSPSFKSFFTKKAPNHLIENSKQDQSVDLEDKPFESPIKKAANSKFSAESSSKLSKDPSAVTALLSPFETPVKCINQSPLGTTSAMKTPVDPASSTPSLCPPKRCHMSLADDDSYESPNKLVRRPPPKRPLNFGTPIKSRNSSRLDDTLDILPEALVQSIQEKERLAEMERDPLISLAKLRMKMILSLPRRFDMIYYFFQSIGRSVVNKEELIHKIISGDLKVSDRAEVEEQLRLLQELAPEWISEKTMSTGDILVCVNKIVSPEVIRKRLSEAK